jgi:hypothetical protein
MCDPKDAARPRIKIGTLLLYDDFICGLITKMDPPESEYKRIKGGPK